MNNDFRIFVVDDVPATLHVLLAGLGKDYAVKAFASAEECLQSLETDGPDLFLLDVGLPGMDGYELCQCIRQLPESRATPVIFISSLDDLDSRLKGYDAGGQDFIVKPYRMAELKQKIEVIRQGQQAQAQLRQMATESEMLTSMILTNLDEYAVLIKFLRQLNVCMQPRQVAEAVLAMLQAYHLTGAVQIRTKRMAFTVTQDGEGNPLEESIINHLRDDGRIVSFKSRCALNFDRVTLLVGKMPVDDPELMGRLRDHLAIAAECVDARLEALVATETNTRTQGEIGKLADALCGSIDDFRLKHDQARIQATAIAHQLPFDLSRLFAGLGMSDSQEEEIQEFFETKASELANVFDLSSATNSTLSELEQRLRTILEI